jgi:sulfate transport system substrate-binding protein
VTEIKLKLDRRSVITAAAGGVAALAAPAVLRGGAHAAPAPVTLLNVSYDPTRELYKAVNVAFTGFWKSRTGQDLTINQSHGGSGAQARSVIDGLQADVVTLALAYDIDSIADHGLIAQNWQSRLPDNSTPYTSTVVFLVKKGNPQHIRDWNDLLKPNVQVITANPKTSGGARWNILAAYYWALKQPGGSPASAKAYIGDLLKHVPVLDSGSRGATTTFTERGVGDVLLAWENEAYLSQAEFPGKFDIVFPSISILAEPPVAVVDKIVDKRGTRTVAEAYLNFLYSPLAQDIIAQNHYRARNAQTIARFQANFPKLPLASIDADFGGWRKAQADFFADGGLFDQVYKPS